MSNHPHCVAFADAYGEAEDAGRTPMNWHGRQELKAIRRGVEATLPAAPAASDLVAPYDLTPGREYNAPPMDDY